MFLLYWSLSNPSFSNPSTEENSQYKDIVHVEIFVYLSIRMISEILSLPRFTIVKSCPLREMLLLEIIRNTFQNKECCLFVVIQQSIWRILLKKKGEFC